MPDELRQFRHRGFALSCDMEDLHYQYRQGLFDAAEFTTQKIAETTYWNSSEAANNDGTMFRFGRYKMSKYLIGALLAAAIGLPGAAIADETILAEEAAVLATEDAWVRAEVARDEATLRRILDDQFVRNDASGTTSAKEAVIQSILGMNMTGQTISERSVLVAGGTAVTFGTAKMHLAVPDSDDVVVLLRYTTTYVKRNGEWRAIALHMSGRQPDE